MWHGQPIRIILSFFLLLLLFEERCFPIFTEVLSSPIQIHFSLGISLLEKTLPIAAKVQSVLNENDKHISKNCVTTICRFISKSLTVTGFIFKVLYHYYLHYICCNNRFFILTIKFFCKLGLIALFKIQAVFLFPQA